MEIPMYDGFVYTLVPITRSNAMPTVMYDDAFNATRAIGKHTLKALVIPFDFRRS